MVESNQSQRENGVGSPGAGGEAAREAARSSALPQDQLRALYQIIERMNSVYELPDLLAFILDRVLEYTGGLRGYLLLDRETADGENNPRLAVEAVRGQEVDQIRAESDALRFVSGTVACDVLQKGEPRVIEDIQHDERYREAAGALTSEFKWRSILAIPLKAADRLIGLMYIEHPGRNAFPNPDLEFLSAFAGQAAVAIDRARQSQRRIEELERLSQISRSVVRVLDLDQVLIRILHEAARLLNVETGSVLLVDEETGELAFRVSVQDGRSVEIRQRLAVGQGVAGWVAQHGEPLLAPDARREPRWYGEVEQGFETRSILCVPLKTNGRVIGVLQALNKKGPVGFTDRDLSLFSAFAASATVAIENARLFTEARQARELRALNEVAAVLSGTLELDIVLETGLAKALEVIQAEAGAVSLVDEASGELVMAATHGWRRDSVPVGTRIPVDQGLSSIVAATGEALVTSDVKHDPRVAIEAFRDEGVQAMVLVPMRAGGEVLGVLSGMSYEPYTFTAGEIDVLSTIGGMFGAAVGNARLYDEVRANLKQLAYLNEVGGALTASLDLEQVLQIIMEGVTSLIGVERASIFLIDEASGDLVLEYNLGGGDRIRLPRPWPGIVGWIAAHGEPIIVNDVRRDPRFLPDIDTATQFDTRAILGAPLKLDERIIGAIELLNKEGGPFTEADCDLLLGFSKWAAIALHNARLYQELDEATERLASVEAVAVMSDMALNLTHRLNNRISVARVDAARIQAKCPDELKNSYLSDKIERIHRVTTESLNIIRRIREPFEVADVEPVDVSDCLAEALRTCQVAPGIQVIEAYEPDLPPVMATREKLIETFNHVLGNALDALEGAETGHLRLQVRYRPDRLVEVVITDDGTGISPAVQAHLFEPFFTTKKGDSGGLGLGLWLTRMYVSRLGGQVELDSTPGQEPGQGPGQGPKQGTTVRIRLPAVQEGVKGDKGT
ncbi:MAG TPA: GAF domain-containing protein [Chloroflexi bacterium]|nr:GAF domain-containing protein [Chloroflexota bacterium]